MNSFLKYPSEESIILLNQPSLALQTVLADLHKIGYNSVSIITDDEEDQNLTDPKVAVYE